jgi:hypothetical protein
MSGTYGAPVQPPVGPVRSPRGLVDVEVTAEHLVLRPHGSWRDWFDSDLVVGLVALLGVFVVLAGFVVGGPLGVVVSVLGALLVLPLILLQVATYAAMAWFLGRGIVLLLTRRGRARLKRGALGVMDTLDQAGRAWRVPRAEVGTPGQVELSMRARLRLPTSSGDLVLSTARRHHQRLEAVAAALRSR